MSAQQEPTMMFVSQGTAEWSRMWGALAQHPCNAALEPEARAIATNDKFGGEVWQYMGTVCKPNGPAIHHEFRHRAHPTTDERTYVRIAAGRNV